MFDQLITFGCSNTYGLGLKDCYTKKDNKTPSIHAWPSILGQLLNLQVVNLSNPASSNKQIWKTILNTTLTKKDLVIVNWSHFDRWCIFKKNGLEKLGSWSANTDKSSKYFFKYLHDNYDMEIDLHGRSDHIARYLEDIGVTSYQLLIRKSHKTIHCDWNKAEYLPLDFRDIRQNFPRALDSQHPGEEAHQAYAQEIYKYIKNDFNKNT